jgi:hypothetical protein
MRRSYRTIKAFPLTYSVSFEAVEPWQESSGEYPGVMRYGKEYQDEESFTKKKVDSHPWPLLLPTVDRHPVASGKRFGALTDLQR